MENIFKRLDDKLELRHRQLDYLKRRADEVAGKHNKAETDGMGLCVL